MADIPAWDEIREASGLPDAARDEVDEANRQYFEDSRKVFEDRHYGVKLLVDKASKIATQLSAVLSELRHSEHYRCCNTGGQPH
jgi:hypothetical protein